MKKNKILLLIISFFALSIFLMACSAPAEEEAEAPAAEEAEAPAAEEEVMEEAAEPVTLTWLIADDANFVNQAEALADAYMEMHPNITIEIETRPGGGDGDNLVKTRLATGEMNDIFSYNSGSLFQALNPTQTLVDLSNEPFIDNIAEAFFPSVMADGKIYGVPDGTATGGGILYNKNVYADLGLEVPKTWDEFVANNEVIQEAGITPVIATYGDTWTSQLFVLADYYNVEQAYPNFADEYTNNQAKYATNPAAIKGFQYTQAGYDKGWYQEDFATDTLETGLTMLAEGRGAHYPQLTFIMGALIGIAPDSVNDIGFFGVPGDDPDTSGATIWVPGGAYIPASSEHIEEAKMFLEYIITPEALAIAAEVNPPTGPYMIKGVELPDTVLPAVQDTAVYIESGKSGPALEFVSPIKGPALEQILVAVGSGQMTAEEGAAAYDEDVRKQAQQLGLEGWEE